MKARRKDVVSIPPATAIVEKIPTQSTPPLDAGFENVSAREPDEDD
jgi:hypothetical protein